MKALYILIIVVNRDINSAITIIDLVEAPKRIIIKGPKDTFGKEFLEVLEERSLKHSALEEEKFLDEAQNFFLFLKSGANLLKI